MNDLKNFMEVTQARTMSEAAKKLGITQPALSESVKRLESDLAQILLYRSRSGITLTPSGQAVLTSAKNALSYLAEIESVRLLGTRFGSRVITIGCHVTVASYGLPATLKILERKAPDYKINLRHGLSRTIQSEIQQGKIDVGVVVNANPSPDLVIRKLAGDEVAVWAGKHGTSDKVFCNLDLVQTQAILRKWRNQPPVVVHTESLELILQLAETGLGFGILPERAVRLHESRHGSFDLRRVENTPVFQDTISLLYRPEFGKSSLEREVVQALTQAFA